MKKLVVFDLDGTVCDNRHRQHLVSHLSSHKDSGEDFEKAMERFNSLCHKDEPVEASVAIAKAMHCQGYDLLFLTARPMKWAIETGMWLKKHFRDVPHALMARPTGDYRSSPVVKSELLSNHVDGDLSRVLCAFEDDPRVVAEFRKMGIVVYQIAGFGEDFSSTDSG